MDADARRKLIGLIRQRKSLGIKRGVRRVQPQLQPDGVRLSYTSELLQWLAPLGAEVARRLVPLIPEDPAPQKSDAPKRSMSAELKKIEAEFGRRLDAETAKLEGIATRAALRTNDAQREAFEKQVREAVGVKLPDKIAGKPLERVVSGFVRQNVDLIKSVPAKYFEKLGELVSSVGSHRAETMAKDIAERFNVAESSAKLIARDQVGKLFGQLNAARQVAAGVTRFIWRTSRDERVRSAHQALDGHSFSWDSPPAEGIPGEAIQCRCGAEPDFSEVASASA